MSDLLHNIFDELKNALRGEVYTDKLRRYMLSTDGSIFRVEPACVVYPKNSDDVAETCRFAWDHNLSVHCRGAGSGLCGSSVGKGIVLDFSKHMHGLISFEKISDAEAYFTCEPGYKYGELEKFLEGTGFFFPPSPSSGEYATFGGMYGTNAGGAYSVKYGNVSDYVEDAELVFWDGTVTTLSEIESVPPEDLPPHLKNLYDLLESRAGDIEKAYPDIACNVCGYDLRGAVKNGRLRLHRVIGGSEGTFCAVTRIKFRLVRKLPADSLVVAYFNDKTSSAKAAQIALKFDPAGIEIMDKSLLELAVSQEPALADKIPVGIDNVLLIEFDGESAEEVGGYAKETVSAIISQSLTDRAFTALNEEEKAGFWAVRKAAVPILYLLKGKKKILALVEDAAVPTARLVEYFDGLYEIFDRRGVKFVSYGHIAKGLLHNRPLLDLKDPCDIELLKVLADDVFELVSKLGGTISGEHGDGRLRSCYIPEQYEKIYDVFLRVKSLLDPEGTFNPDIKTTDDPWQMTKYLRYGQDYGAADPGRKILVWNEDMTLEAEKCHGCSKCTTVTSATRMCPVYKATRDEAAAPKAKANILRALLSNAVDTKSIYSEAFQSVINNCVNCGSCSIECPSRVNIPKLALEAKARYAEKYGVPLEARIVTNFELAGRTVGRFGGALSAVMKPKFARKISEICTGLACEREFVSFAPNSLFRRVNRTEGDGGRTVLYFAGCYASYIRPEIGESAVNVLKKLGFKVLVPEQRCCGIPHLSKGMAPQAKKQIAKNVSAWGKLAREADFITGTCSSCVLSLAKEWGYCVKDDDTEMIASKTVYISDLISEVLAGTPDKKGDLRLAYHRPCHMRLLKNPQSSFNMLRSIDGVETEDLKSNCCGMAGSWGISAGHYDLSVKIGAPMAEKLKNSAAEFGVTDCPTCAMQMEHLSGKKVFHPIEVLDKCLKD